MMAPKKTEKADWMNDALAALGGLVSDHVSYARIIGLSDGITASVRYVGNRRIGYHLLLVLISDNEGMDVEEELKKSIAHSSNLAVFGIKVDQIILCLGSNFFSIIDNIITLMTEDSLARFFYGINSIMEPSGNGAVKRLNKSMNDRFQDFTRRNLSSFVTCNDIDAILLPSGSRDRPIFIELKRPLNEIREWRPYASDMANYRAAKSVADMCGGQAIAISYNEVSDPNFLLLHYQIKSVTTNDEALGAIQNMEIWSWRITLEKMVPEHQVSIPLHHSGKTHGWLSHWIQFELLNGDDRDRVLVDTSRSAVLRL